ncbi:hypothetical protein ACKWTF_015859 [Chironomus riparius]
MKQNLNYQLENGSDFPGTASTQEHTSRFSPIEHSILSIKCKDFSAVIQAFDERNIKNELDNLETILLLKFDVDEPCDKLNAKDLLKLSNKCKNKSIIIQFSKNYEENHAIHWKLKTIQKFMSFLPDEEALITNEDVFYDFLETFILEAMKNGNLGLLSCISPGNGGFDIRLCHIADSRGLNLLLIASETGNNDVVKTLLNQNLKMEFKCNETGIITSASDLAWKNRNCDVILTLLNINLTYPEGFDVSECSDELKQFITSTEELHNAIESRDQDKIQNILNENSKLSHFFNTRNVSAPKLALNLKFIDIYELLLKNKIFLGYHETMSDLWTAFNDSERELLREIHFKHSINVAKKHLISLSTNSSISHDDPQATQKLEYVRYAFGILNNNPLIRIILMIVAASKIFNIIFDFNRQSVNVVDPTADSWTRGLFYITGRIYIGAAELLNRSTESQAFGTLAHELCHYAMNLVYENRAKPYLSSDKETKAEFSRISKICKENSIKNDIIHQVYKSYPKRMHHAELIVRVPHLFAMYSDEPEQMNEIRKDFKDLFEFYENRVVGDMEKALPKIEAENQIQKKAKKILKYKIILIIVGLLSIFGLVASIFIVKSIFYTPDYKFDELTDIEKDKILNSLIIYKNNVIEFQNLIPKNSLAYKKLRSDHILQLLEGKKLNFSDPYLHYLDEFVVHHWNHLTEILRQKVLDSNFTFQNETLKFHNLNNVNSEILESLTSQQISQILDGFNLNVSKMIVNETKFFVDRKILDEDMCQIFYEYMSNITEGKVYRTLEGNVTTNLEFFDFYRDFKQQNYSTYSKKIEQIKFSFNYRFNKRFGLNHWCPPYKAFLNDTMITRDDLFFDFNQVIDLANETKMFILSSEAGTGKTETFRHLTIKIKKKFPMHWVSYIDLKNHLELYNKNEYLLNIEIFLEKILSINQENKFERKIFSKFYNSNRLILLWNGFDEIAPNYNEFIVNVLKLIQKNTKNIQYICTRPFYVQQLRENLHISVFNLFQLNNDFLRQFYMTRKENEIGISDFINKVKAIILNLHSSSGQDLNKFYTPLMILMISELVLNDVEINEKENIYRIYEKFAEKKIEIWQDKGSYASILQKSEISGGKTLNIKEILQKYAIESLTFIGIKKKVKGLSIFRQKIPKKLTLAEISRMGILYFNDENNYEFVHRTFAEFFIAQYLVENVYEAIDVSVEEAELRIYLFFEEIIISKKIMTTKFLDSFLQTNAANESQYFSKTIVDVLTSKFKNVFFASLSYKHSDFLEMMIKFFKKDHKLLLKLLHVDQDETLYTSTFNFAYFKSQDNYDVYHQIYIADVMKNMSKNYLSKQEFDKFMNGRNQKGIILYSLYLFYKSDYLIEHEDYSLDMKVLESANISFVFESIAANLTKSEILKLFLSNESPIYDRANPPFQDENFMKIVEKILTKDECKMFLRNNIESLAILQYSTYFHQESISSETFDFFINVSKNYLHKTEICEFIIEKNLMHIATFFKNFEIFWNFCINFTTNDQKKEILLKKVEWTIDIKADQKYSVLPIQFPPFELFYWNLMSVPMIKDSFISNLYASKFNIKEIQQILLGSSHWEPFDKYLNSGANGFENFLEYLNETLEGNLTLIRNFFQLNLQPENKNLLRYLKDEDLYYNELNLIAEMFNITLKN